MKNGKLTVLAPAKINLYFGVIGVRGDGYHEIETILQTIDLFDRIKVEVSSGDENTVRVKCGCLENVSERENIAYKAAMRYIEKANLEKTVVDICIDKKIPSGSGLGGGSSDAAAVLLALSYLDGDKFTLAELMDIGATIGADVPFCIKKGTAKATGFGEIVAGCTPMPDCRILIAVPKGEKTVTAEAYAKFDDAGYPSTFEKSLGSLETCDFSEIVKYMKNDFENVTKESSASMKIKKILLSSGAIAAQMSGSGPSVFGIFSSQAEAKRAAELTDGLADVYICSPARRDFAYFEK